MTTTDFHPTISPNGSSFGSLHLDSLVLNTQALQSSNCTLQRLSHADYQATHDAMLAKTLQKIEQKQQGTPLPDELWLVEHTDVYTLGQAGKREHILKQTDTPIIQTDRGGQVTWHGTGQLVVYFLWDLTALGFGVRDLVSHAEQAIEDTLTHFLPSSVYAKARKDAPGVYIYSHDSENHGGEMIGKIASLGFKIKHGHSYHGIAINLNNDLSHFFAINPCGYAGMAMVRLADFCQVKNSDFIAYLLDNLAQRRLGIIKLR